MGVTVRQDERGRWCVFIHHKRRRKRKCFNADKAAAERAATALREALARSDLGVRLEREKRPFDGYFRNWLALYASTHVKRTTYNGYAASGRHYLIPAFGTKDIRDITRDDVKQLVATLYAKTGRRGKPLARATIKAVLAPLREMFNHAVEDGHVPSNPALRILKRTRLEAQSRRAPDQEFLTAEESGRLLRACRELYPRFYPFVLTLARTGMRLGEVLGLEWGDIDVGERYAVVRRAIVQKHLETPKGGKSRRVDLSQHLTETLRALRVEQRREALRLGTPVPVRLFPTIDPNNFRRREWHRMLERAELRYVPIKALRHSFASLHLANRESTAYVRDQLGHSSIQVTVDVYGHLVPGGNRGAADRLDAVASPDAHAHAPQAHPVTGDAP